MKNIFLYLLMLCAFYIALNYSMIDRISNIATGLDNSAIIRIFRPFYFIYLSILNHPLFGVGLLNNEYLLNLYYNYTNDSFAINRFSGNIYILNNIGAHFSYFGILGSSIIGIILYKLFNSLMVQKNMIFFMIFFLISLTEGPYTGQRPWSYAFILLATIKINNQSILVNES